MEDNSSNLTKYWKGKLDDVLKGEFDPPGPGATLTQSFGAIMSEQPENQRVPDSTRGHWEGVTGSVAKQRTEVKRAFGFRKEYSVPAEPDAKGFVKHAHEYDPTKILKNMDDMAKRFNEKVAPPTSAIRASRIKEQAGALVTDFCRGNELFDKKDYEAALAEYERCAETVAPLRVFAMINRGNAFKALEMPSEAIACYQDALDEIDLKTPDGRLIHSFACNNLGAASQDDGRLDQALQHLGAAMYGNPRCYLAIRNRANVHMHVAEQLETTGQPSLLPPQHELALSFFAKAAEDDWHLPVVFSTGNEPATGLPVRVRTESRITSNREEPTAQMLRNSVYHFTTNLTHVTSTHL
jgi:tetratricopeptide (TPR) repeat protein